jgi:hypothetical protein
MTISRVVNMKIKRGIVKEDVYSSNANIMINKGMDKESARINHAKMVSKELIMEDARINHAKMVSKELITDVVNQQNAIKVNNIIIRVIV